MKFFIFFKKEINFFSKKLKICFLKKKYIFDENQLFLNICSGTYWLCLDLNSYRPFLFTTELQLLEQIDSSLQNLTFQNFHLLLLCSFSWFATISLNSNRKTVKA